MKTRIHNELTAGIKDGIPIALGYLSVSFAFGVSVVNNGLPLWSAVLISLTNLTSAGQVAGLTVMLSSGTLFEMALTQLVINLRYMLMSLSWSQKMDSSVTLGQRCIVAFGNTDEIFAVSSTREGTLGFKYLVGLILLPVIGWTFGTFLGGAASAVMPEIVRESLGVAIYGMFLAIIIPPAKKERAVLVVVLIAVSISCAFAWMPFLQEVSGGFVIIIAAVIASALGAWLFPRNDQEACPSETKNVEVTV